MRVLVLPGYAPEHARPHVEAVRSVDASVEFVALHDVPSPVRKILPLDASSVGPEWFAPRPLPPIPRVLPSLVRRTHTRPYDGVVRSIERATGPIDVIHGHFYSSTLGVGWSDWPLVITEHTNAFTRPAPRRQRWRNARVARDAYAQARAVLPVSEHLRRDLARHVGSAPYTVIPNPVDVASIPVVALPPSSEEIRVVCVSRLEPNKGQDVLLEAFASAVVAEPRLRLRIIGTGGQRAELERAIRRRGLASVVSMLGFLPHDQVIREITGAHILVSSSLGESFCIPIIEALCAGRPVLATRVGVAEDVIGPSCGRLVTPADAKGMSAGLVELANALGGFRPEAIAGRPRKDFSLRAVGMQLLEIYQQLTLAGEAIVR